ncbi:uncharacterized protein LOC143200208 [Rhynchophorus ferrugineus]|uniref:uncharacterized protein LOC143200208 n=1 Tax=Rhynchophorus ferrugineus TaxID=354439 RepID=UPI003FCCA066
MYMSGVGTPVPFEVVGGRAGRARPLAVDCAALPGGDQAGMQNRHTQDEYDKYIMILSEGDLLTSLSPFIIHRELLSAVGEVQLVKKLRNGTILAAVSNFRQSDGVLKHKKFDSIQVTVAPHNTLHFCKGVILSRELSVCTDEEILENLASQRVTSVKCIVSKRNGKIVATNSYILTFRKDHIPEKIKAGYLSLKVRQWIPNSMRSYQCQRFGHMFMNCTYDPIFLSCGKDTYGKVECSLPPHCVNCG